MNLTTFVGNLAFICTIASNFAGVQICHRFISSKTTGGVSSLTFIGGILCTSLWLQYGLLIRDTVQIAVNMFSTMLQCVYIFCFYLYTDNKKFLLVQLLPVLSFVSIFFYYIAYFATETEFLVNLAGVLACTGSITACIAPMVSVREVFRTKNTSVLPFPIILATFIVTNLWFLYGILIHDKFLQIPNFICAILSGLQLTLFLVFPSKKLK